MYSSNNYLQQCNKFFFLELQEIPASSNAVSVCLHPPLPLLTFRPPSPSQGQSTLKQALRLVDRRPQRHHLWLHSVTQEDGLRRKPTTTSCSGRGGMGLQNEKLKWKRRRRRKQLALWQAVTLLENAGMVMICHDRSPQNATPRIPAGIQWTPNPKNPPLFHPACPQAVSSSGIVRLLSQGAVGLGAEGGFQLLQLLHDGLVDLKPSRCASLWTISPAW